MFTGFQTFLKNINNRSVIELILNVHISLHMKNLVK